MSTYNRKRADELLAPYSAKSVFSTISIGLADEVRALLAEIDRLTQPAPLHISIMPPGPRFPDQMANDYSLRGAPPGEKSA